MPRPVTTQRLIFFALSLLLILGGVACTPSADDGGLDSGSLPRFEPLPEDAEFPVSGVNLERGYLLVKADRETLDADIYRLPVAIIRANPEQPKRPPVIMISGGPGSGGLAAAAYPGAYPWVGERDFIIFGQRGTRHAQPALLCPDYNSALTKDDPDLLSQAAQNCRNIFRRDGIDLSNFHTKAIAADINDLRMALGYEKVILYGVSYGTRVALTVARDFPEIIDRMILDSPLPHTVRYDAQIAENIERVLGRISQSCEADASCSSAYPDVLSRALTTIQTADTDPLLLTSDMGEKANLGPADIVNLVSLGSSEQVAQAPLRLKAIADRNAEFLAPLWFQEPRTSRLDWGMRLSVWCSEAWPYTKKPEQPFAGLDLAVVSDEVCELWNVPVRPISDRDGTVTDHATLIIAGAFDPMTPAEWAEETVKTLINGRAVILPFGHHSETTNWGGDGCAMSIAASFIQQPEADVGALDVSCISKAQSPAFSLPAND